MAEVVPRPPRQLSRIPEGARRPATRGLQRTGFWLFDTHISIAFLNEKDVALRKRLVHAGPGEVKLCAVVKAELLYGGRNSARVEDNLARLARFFELFDSVPFDDAAAAHYGILRTQLRRNGTPVGANDMLIAATALAADLTLVTRNQDEFHLIGGLRVESW